MFVGRMMFVGGVLSVLAVTHLFLPWSAAADQNNDYTDFAKIGNNTAKDDLGLLKVCDITVVDEIKYGDLSSAGYLSSDWGERLRPKKMLNFGKYQTLAEDSVGVTLMLVGTVGILWAAPESISKWDEDEKNLDINDLKERWKDHTRAGPVWDNDELWINYIGHPYFGAGYYCHTIHKGYSRLDGFLYSLAMSTSLYEYGFEAFFEKPSTQDLIFTPLGGVLMGELFLMAEREIKRNKNRVLGSRRLGDFCRGMMDPVGYSLKNFRGLNDKWTRINYRTRYYTEQRLVPKFAPGYDEFEKDYRYGFQVIIYRE